MPVIKNNTYKPPFYAFNKHVETILPSAWRKVKGVNYERKRIETPDDDFLDLDWINNKHDRLIIVSHGLEGSSDRPYVKGIAKHFSNNNWDVLAWNCRSCSEEMNSTPKLYHHGFTVDVATVVKHAIEKGYNKIGLVGFSMGGSLTLKYVGESEIDLPKQIKACMAVSVPCELSRSSAQLAQNENKFYQDRFMRKLTFKLSQKNEQFPGLIEMRPWKSFKNFDEFDTHYSAKLYNFKDAQDFYGKVQCLPFLKKINIPTLILNAANDPMLSGQCYPVDIATESKHITLEISKYGGHVGFLQANKATTYAEERALGFFDEHMKL